VPVWPDDVADRPGPLAGFLAGLAHCATPYLATVPCDCPLFPLDLVERLGSALADDRVDIALAATPSPTGPRAEPVFALLRASLGADLAAFLKEGGRKVEVWARRQRCELVEFAETEAFFNINTPGDLQALQGRR
jgi:molybdopterin-guanine dinucleotide biosynthesis protein A